MPRRTVLNLGACFGAALLIFTAAQAPAQTTNALSPVGQWKTIDDETNTERSIVEIRQVGSELQGRILKIFPRPGEDPAPLCQQCEGERQNQPIIGMIFLWGLVPDGADSWAGGAVLDPQSGKIYNAKISLTDNGERLRVRGYLGTPLLGRPQIWLRQSGSTSASAD